MILQFWIGASPIHPNTERFYSSPPHLDDQFLVAFLRSCKYDSHMTKQKIDLFFTMRQLMPEITKNRDIRNGTNVDLLKLG